MIYINIGCITAFVFGFYTNETTKTEVKAFLLLKMHTILLQHSIASTVRNLAHCVLRVIVCITDLKKCIVQCKQLTDRMHISPEIVRL